MNEKTDPKAVRQTTPVRGSLRMSVTTSNQQVMAGSNFSIFVIIQNPFDIPITVYQVQTHIPVELIDVNMLRILSAKQALLSQSYTLKDYFFLLLRKVTTKTAYAGVAIAVGTDFDPSAEKQFITMSTNIKEMGDNANIVGVALNFPVNPSSEELDQIFRRIEGYKTGTIPNTLQP
jgi:hypothetical protein